MVVVTGASTGIGKASVLLLLSRGLVVYAGVRSDQQGQQLAAEAGANSNLIPIILDVTNQSDITGAASRVAAELGNSPLTGIVNNAGIAVAAPLEYLKLDDLRNQLEVNLIGQVAMAQAFLPQLRQHKGRLVNVGSVSGLVSTRLLGAYSASKFALEAVNDAFRRELKPHGVAVSLVEPGRISTPIWDKSMAEGLRRMAEAEPAAREYYGQLVDDLVLTAEEAKTKGTKPEAVARAVYRALTEKRPRTRYFVGSDAHTINVLRRVLSDPMFDRLINATRR